jgi:hypothetical protein
VYRPRDTRSSLSSRVGRDFDHETIETDERERFTVYVEAARSVAARRDSASDRRFLEIIARDPERSMSESAAVHFVDHVAQAAKDEAELDRRGRSLADFVVRFPYATGRLDGSDWLQRTLSTSDSLLALRVLADGGRTRRVREASLSGQPATRRDGSRTLGSS